MSVLLIFAGKMDIDKCCVCQEHIDDIKLCTTLRDKGAQSLNNASKQRCAHLIFNKGDKVHISCRKKYINPKYIKSDIKSVSADSNVQHSFRSKDDFDYKWLDDNK